MAKKSSIAKQAHREVLANRQWHKRQELKKVIKDFGSTEEERQDAMYRLNRMPKNGSSVRLRNRCKLTGRARGYHRKFGLSRLCLRELALSGYIPGMVKSSW